MSGREDVFLEYELPGEMVAQRPPASRGDSRLLLVDRGRGVIEDGPFSRLPDLLAPGDVLVLNDSRVVPSRVDARKQGSGGRVEIVFLDWAGSLWRGLVKGSVKPGSLLEVEGWPRPLSVTACAGGVAEVESPSPGEPMAFFHAVGRMPLPPYIRRGDDRGIDDEDRERYQTVFAGREGSVAAPTAGLHFTGELLGRLREGGVETATVTLHVGWGTFSPIRGDWRRHRLHPEWGSVSTAAAGTLNRALGEGRRVVAVGTTSTRLLESRWSDGRVVPGEGPVDLYITPGFDFRVAGALLTNFHRPRSSLLLLVDAFAGSDLMRRAYAEAVRLGYRFFSYGDAMLIV